MLATRPFGRTGHRSSRVIFGAAALGAMRQERADEVLALLLDAGINHLDTAASYGDSELRLAPWLTRHRDEFFLATKTGERTADGARAELERSLARLGVDSVDLVQLHNLVEADEFATAHGPGGAVEGLQRARDEGLCRFIGVTGHGTRIAAMHRQSLERFDFDSVLIPYNFTLLELPDYRASVDELLEICGQRGVAVQTIKSLARRRWPDPADARFAWYEPISDPGVLDRSVRWVLAHDQLFLNTSSDARLLRPTVAAAQSTAPPPDDAQMAADALGHGIRPLFDGTDLERI